MQVLGIDIAPDASKGAPVDLATGALAAPRWRCDTPTPPTPEAVADLVRDAVTHFGWKGPVGVSLPADVRVGVVRATGLDDGRWVGVEAADLFTRRAGTRVQVVGGADAVGLAECRFGAARHAEGVVVVLTFGDGIGSALLSNGRLVPASRLGALEVRGRRAERRASERARDEKDLSWRRWAERIDEFLGSLDAVLGPDLVVLGGAVAKQADRILPRLTVDLPVVAGTLLGAAGMVGAALAGATAVDGADPLPDPAGTPTS